MNLFETYIKVGLKDEASEGAKNLTQTLGSGLKKAATVGLAAVGAASAGMVSITKKAVEEYAEYEQLVGGVETLFKESADTVTGYAKQAHKTAGLSATAYMSTVTSFSASLLQSLGGDTAAAADLANQALTDMSDNANKMGTDISMIQNAYQGFAKQNYTMLDNLKLGYGGTQAEMKRLIREAAALDDSIDASSMSFANIVKAINVVQTELGITGTTAKEAATTISGSVGSAKAAWSNLVAGFADENANMDQLVNEFVDSVVVAGQNVIPKVAQIGESVVGVVKNYGNVAVNMVRLNAPKLWEDITKHLEEELPADLSAAKKYIEIFLNTAADFVGDESNQAKFYSIVESVGDALAKDNKGMRKAAGNFAGSLADFLTSDETIKTVGDAFDTLQEEIAMASGALGANVAYSISKNIVSGIAEGIKDGNPADLFIDMMLSRVERGALGIGYDVLRGGLEVAGIKLPKLEDAVKSFYTADWFDIGDVSKKEVGTAKYNAGTIGQSNAESVKYENTFNIYAEDGESAERFARRVANALQDLHDRRQAAYR